MFLSKHFYILVLVFFGLAFQKVEKTNKSKKQAEPKETVPNAVKTEAVWLEAIALKNETFSGILQRYNLYDYECNARKFLEINKMDEGFKLKTGRIYKMPITIEKYNGKSIRTTLDIKDLNVALHIENYNKSALEKGLRKDNFIKTKDLWVPWHELNCPAEGELEEASNQVISAEKSYIGNREFPIFGKKYQKTPLIDRKMKGKVFYIISGHGGPDGGAEGKRGGKTLCEDEYSYDVALRLVRLLVSHGATAYMIVRDPNDGIRDDEYLTCDTDEKVWGNLEIPRVQKERLFQRSGLINEMTKKNDKAGVKDQTIIEIHVDSRSQNAKTDVFFYFRPGSSDSEKLARGFHATFAQKYLKVRAQRHYSGTVTPRALHTLRETIAPKAVYIELGNIRNFHDQHRLVLSKNRQVLANWMLEALTLKK